MAYFFVPKGAPAKDYDVDNKKFPGSVGRMRVPVESSRDIALWGGNNLLRVRSSDSRFVQSAPPIIHDDGDAVQVFRIAGKMAGTCRLEARLPDPADYNNESKGVVWASIDVVVTEAPWPTLGKRIKDVAFHTLWSNYPKTSKPCQRMVRTRGGKEILAVSNQCAIRFCVALTNCGVGFPGYTGPSCGGKSEHRFHFVDPYSLGTWLAKPAQLGAPKKYIKGKLRKGQSAGDVNNAFGQSILNEIRGRNGIVVFWYFFDPMHDGNMWGGHIDFWDGYAQASGNANDSYFARSKEVWFFAISK
jgi:hypothetical protein